MNIGGSCTVYQNYLLPDGITVSTRIYKSGMYTSISLTNCPVDDYIPLLFIFTAGIAFLQIRKRLALIKDEDLHHYRSL